MSKVMLYPPAEALQQAVVQRSLDDILSSERRLRDIAEDRMREFRGVLITLALHIAGTAVEAARREDPYTLEKWTPAQWSDFFMSKVLGATWANVPSDERLRLEKDQLAEQCIQLKDQVAQLQSELTDTHKEAKRLRDDIERENKKRIQTVSSGTKTGGNIVIGGSNPEAEKRDDVHINAPTLIRAAEDIASAGTADVPSVMLKHLARLSPMLQRRGMMALRLIAIHGISARLEIDLLTCAVEGLRPRSKAARDAMDAMVLPEIGLCVSEKLEIRRQALSTSLVLLRLTDTGRQACREAWGAEAVQTDWERLIHLHQGSVQMEHTLACMILAIHARARGWMAKILPSVDGAQTQPDLMVERSSEMYYVEVETGSKQKDHKWRNIAAVHPQGKVAVCTLDGASRSTLVQDCRALGLHGAATDIASLIYTNPQAAASDPASLKVRHFEAILPDVPLWVETF